jgi:hypothetical protein
LLAADELPAASRALTVKVKLVPEARPEAVKLVLVVTPIAVPPRDTSYPVTPTLSVDAFQASEMLEAVVAVTRRLAGAVGG